MLTTAAARAGRSRVGPYRLADSAGLSLTATPAGTKSWRLRTPLNQRQVSRSARAALNDRMWVFAIGDVFERRHPDA